MKVHEIINDDLTIHYLIHMDPDDMKGLKVLAQHADNAMDGLDLGDYARAALLATIFANYPITTYQQKIAANDVIPLPKTE